MAQIHGQTLPAALFVWAGLAFSSPGASANRCLDHTFCIAVLHPDPHTVPLGRSPDVHPDGVADVHSDGIADFRINYSRVVLSNRFGNAHGPGLDHCQFLAVTISIRHVHTDGEPHTGATADCGNRTPFFHPHQRDCLVWDGGQPLR